MQFSEKLPLHCPPEDASSAVGRIYRFVRQDPPSRKDMQSWEEEGRNSGQGDPCQRCALSILVDEGDIASARAAVPVFRKRKVAVATMLAAHGCIKQTGNSAWHHSLWLERSIVETVHTMFQVVRI